MAHPSADAVAGLYERRAADWSRARRVSAYEEGWLRRFAALVPAASRVLDLGCGDGDPIGRWLLDRTLQVTGLDAAPSLIARAAAALPQGEWVVGDMRTVDLAHRFAGIVAWYSLFHLTPDAQADVVPRLARLAEPGAPLMFCSGLEHGEAIGEWCGEPLYHGSLSPDGYRAALASADFTVLAAEPHPQTIGPGLVWLAQRNDAPPT